MKIPLKWLADYVPLDLPVAELAQRLTLAGLEVSGFRSYGLPVPEGLRVRQDEPGPVWDRDKIVITRVLSVGKHPNAEKLKLPVVEYPVGAEKTILTGAPNLGVGDCFPGWLATSRRWTDSICASCCRRSAPRCCCRRWCC